MLASQKSLRLSAMQYGQLKEIQAAGVLGIESITNYKQIPLGGLHRRDLVIENKNRDGLQITQLGKLAIKAYDQAEFLRKVASTDFSSYLNLDSHWIETKERRQKKRPHKIKLVKPLKRKMSVAEFKKRNRIK